MTTPAAPDTVNSVGATDDASKGGLFNSLNNTTLSTIEQAIATRATSAATSATDALASKNAAETAKTASEAAQAASETARTQSQTAQAASETARDASIAAKTSSETARDASIAAKTASETARDASVTAKNASESARDTAVTKAGEALSSAGNAASSETAAGNSATAAGNSATAAAASFDAFDDRYLGNKTSDPTVDNDGNALLTGALYFKTTDNIMRAYTGSAWVTVKPNTTEQGHINTVSGIQANVTKVANIDSNVTSVANIDTDVTAVAGKATEIGRLGTTDAVADMNLLGTQTVVDDMALLGVQTVIDDMALLAVPAVITDMDLLGASGVIPNISTVAGISSDVTSVADNNANVTTVAGLFSGTQTFAVTIVNSGGNKFAIDGVAAPALTLVKGFTYTFDVSDGTNSGHPLRFKDASGNSFSTGVTVTGSAGQAGAKVVLAVPSTGTQPARYYCTVHGNGMGNSITTTTNDIAQVLTISNEITTVAGISSNVTTVAGISSAVSAVSSNATNINTVSGISSNVTTVAGISANVTTVAGIHANVTTVAGIQANVTVVANMSSNVNTVAGIAGNITTVAGMNSNITSVVNNASNINTVAGISSNVTTVAGDTTEINAVAGNATNINAVAGNASNINTVAGISSNINTVAGISANVNSVANNSSNINTVATNITNVNAFANTYFIGSSAPTGGTIGEGDLWYDTTNDEMKVHNGSSFVTFVSAYDTDDLSEGSSNLYYTNTRADARITNAFSNAVSLGNNLTVAGELRGPATFVIDPAVVGNNTGTVQVKGNLQVDGTTTTINSTTLDVTDKNVTVAKGSNNAAAANGAGLTVDCGSNTDATFTYTNSDDSWNVNKNLNATIGTAAQANITSVGTLTGLTVNGDATFTGASYNVLWDKSQNSLEFADSARATFGSSRDFQLQFNGSNGLIENYTGDLFISNFANDQDIFIRSDNGSGGFTTYVKAEGSTGEAQLYHYGTEKLATKSTGVQVTGDLETTADIELGHASDTTIARASAGVVTIEGNTVLTTGNSDTPTTTTSSGDADFVLVDDGGTMKKITPANLGVVSGAATQGFAVAMAIAL